MKARKVAAAFFILLFIGSTLSLYSGGASALLIALSTSKPLPLAVISPPPLAQSFGIGTDKACGSSNRNCFIMDNGSLIQNFKATWHLAGPLLGSSPLSPLKGNFSFQLNSYAPQGYEAAYNQYVVTVFKSGTNTHSLLLEAQYISASDATVAQAGGLLIPVPSSVFDAGYNITIALTTNILTDAVMVSSGILDPKGNLIYSDSIDLEKNFPKFLTPSVGFEAQLIGDCCADTAIFTQASGEIVYSADSPIGWTSAFPGSFPWVQYPNIGTVEKSNVNYGAFPKIIQTSSTSSSTSTSSETLVPFVGKVCNSAKPQTSGIGFDKGQLDFCYSSNGSMSMFNPISKINFTIASVSVDVDSKNFSLVSRGFRNSSSIVINYQGATVDGLTTYATNFNIIFKNASDTDQYSKEVIIAGTTTQLGGKVALRFLNQEKLLTSSSDTQYCISTLCLDFSDSLALDPTLSGNGLSFSVSSDFKIDPVWIDSSNSCSATSGTTCAISLTTVNANTLIIVMSNARASSGHIIISSISDGTNTYTARQQLAWIGNIGSTKYYFEEWKAYRTSSGALTITLTYNATIVNAKAIAFAIAGSDHPNGDFDTATLPQTNTGTGSGNPSVTLSTNNANDLILGMLAADSSSPSLGSCAAGTVGTASYCILTVGNAPNIILTEYRPVLATLSSGTMNFVYSDANKKWAMIGDAVMELPVTVTTTSTTTVTSTTTSTTTTTTTTTENLSSSQGFSLFVIIGIISGFMIIAMIVARKR